MKHALPLIVIIGPTASGKSSLAVDLALRLNSEVISADSRQIYRGLDIGTEKITAREMHGVPHHCIDIASPRRSFSVEQWRRHARRAIDALHARGKTPIVAGGTGLYLDALVYGIDFPAVRPDARLRRALERETPAALLARLRTLDPARARTIEQKNPRRLIRAIEIATALGTVPSLTDRKPRYDVVWIGICPPFSVLETRIADRLDRALAHGLIAETKNLREGLGLSVRRVNELGLEYRIVTAYLAGELTRQEMRDTLVREVRRYAKRQLTWLKRYADVPWYEHATAAQEAFARS